MLTTPVIHRTLSVLYRFTTQLQSTVSLPLLADSPAELYRFHVVNGFVHLFNPHCSAHFEKEIYIKFGTKISARPKPIDYKRTTNNNHLKYGRCIYVIFIAPL